MWKSSERQIELKANYVSQPTQLHTLEQQSVIWFYNGRDAFKANMIPIIYRWKMQLCIWVVHIRSFYLFIYLFLFL
jgi:hypothetical protein